VDLEPRVCAALKDGRLLFLECRPPRGEAAQAFFARYLADPTQWRTYQGRLAVAVRFEQLKPEVQRQVLLGVFKDDHVDTAGWWHTAVCSAQEGQESLWTLCEWLTGKGTNYRAVMDDRRNHLNAAALEKGQRVLIPADLLLAVMKAATPKRCVEAPTPGAEEEPVDLNAAARELNYGSDAQGPYALYRLKPGEALYTAVVARFTDIRDNDAMLKACDLIQRRSGIKDVHDMKPGQRVLIPLDLVSDRFAPKGSEPRRAYEKALGEAKRLRKQQVRTKDLEGVVVVLDPGHGGRDQGGAYEKAGLYEDELNYDIAFRVKKVLETRTRATVHMTLRDLSSGYEPADNTRFVHDTDEELLTTPPYDNYDAKISANLRWYLANATYFDEVRSGADPRKIIFTSFHTDALFDGHMRGAMIYIPGAKYRYGQEQPEGEIYTSFKEAREHRGATSSAAERRRDEALSRNFAEDLMQALGKRRIRRHLEGPWIRSQIRQDGGRVYVPSVLRNTLIPTKVLVEAANLTNQADRERLADPNWRQNFAEAYVDALKTHFGS
jgi:N-acetylmuramoyl-L-alanine amidase